MKEQDIVNLLRHSRHDWLNKIQLIKGYLSFGKLERVNEIIEEIVRQSENESKLSNLPLPQFSALLLTYNWNTNPVVLSYEVLGTGKAINVDDVVFTKWLSQFLQKLNASVSTIDEHQLFLQIILDEEQLRLAVRFNGILVHTESILDFLNKQMAGIYLSAPTISKEEIDFELHF
ncbi:sporulation initiation phosphotransferase B [Caldibacillus lycopersici]|uniref:Sporulation initiation phosphotransferase B n=1 Tax=Perspicuibacillus lycopersici TaxID=1325689 RepID=A0AAE3ISX0_9BACI|nr:sporulation initiation phosphotransferase B [Perspicuibacillus lycopersici]MCU9614000.1 sporulation initiation phosphotransferase B [Perspicuibacillus lycopersici]